LNPNHAVEIRPDRIAIRVTGKDATRLLGDVLSGHIAAETGPARWWALLTPQGKILAEGLCSWADGAFWLDVDESVCESFLKRMRIYKLRADANFEDLSESHAVGWSADPIPDCLCDQDDRGETLGFRAIAPKAETTGWQEGKDFSSRRIGYGLCQLGTDFSPDSQFPHDIGMDLLGGIDFQKGCYIGQEVVSRMKHRGTARRRPAIVSGEGLETGAAVMADGREAGRLGAVLDEQGVAILRLDRITNLDKVTADGRPVRLALPSWADYAFGDSGGGGEK
jgi:tRNA-modifying protein YgfZ